MALATIPTTIAGAMSSHPSNPATSSLHALPMEISARVCEYIERIWLKNLATTCGAMRAKLSFQNSNLTWYRALPRCIWPEEKINPVLSQSPQLPYPLLGGRYHLTCNYRTKIFGRLFIEWRCHICLTYQVPGFVRLWGIKFCEDCGEYTISKS